MLCLLTNAQVVHWYLLPISEQFLQGSNVGPLRLLFLCLSKKKYDISNNMRRLFTNPQVVWWYFLYQFRRSLFRVQILSSPFSVSQKEKHVIWNNMPGLITHSSGAWYQYWSAFFGVQILDQSFVVSVVLKAEKYYYSFSKIFFLVIH